MKMLKRNLKIAKHNFPENPTLCLGHSDGNIKELSRKLLFIIFIHVRA